MLWGINFGQNYPQRSRELHSLVRNLIRHNFVTESKDDAFSCRGVLRVGQDCGPNADEAVVSCRVWGCILGEKILCSATPQPLEMLHYLCDTPLDCDGTQSAVGRLRLEVA